MSGTTNKRDMKSYNSNEIQHDLINWCKWELLEKYGKEIPSYDKPDYHLCKSGEEVDWFEFKEIK